MTDSDNKILHWMVDRDSYATPKVLAYELPDLTYQTINLRLQALLERGMVERPPPEDVPDGVARSGIYRVTDLGRRYVSGELTMKEFREATGEDGIGL